MGGFVLCWQPLQWTKRGQIKHQLFINTASLIDRHFIEMERDEETKVHREFNAKNISCDISGKNERTLDFYTAKSISIFKGVRVWRVL